MVFGETLRRLSRHEAFGGILLMAAAVLAMPVANSPLLPACDGFLAAKPAIPINGTGLAKPLILQINNGLMTMFFLLAGLELKRAGSGLAGLAGLPAWAMLRFSPDP